ncbi:MAG: 4-amino-4-deoxychorismate lyase [Campylobacterota bacterium]|nr:4-amino-4-deoxychorismate lyase [Campylobacterota bacterium]
MCQFIETILIKNGIAKNLFRHQKRVNITTKKHFNSMLIDLKKETLKAPKIGIYRCRVTYSKKVEKVEFSPYVLTKKAKIKAIVTDLDYNFKKNNRKEIEEALKSAKEEGFDEVLFVKNGFVADTSIANIAFFNGKEWFTPIFPILKGTMRERLVDAHFLKKAVIKKEDVAKFSLFALFNSLSGFYIAGSTRNITLGDNGGN